MTRLLKAFYILFFCLFLISCSSDKTSSKKEVSKTANTEKPTSMVKTNEEKEVKDDEEQENESNKEEPKSEEQAEVEEPEVEAEPEGATPEQLKKADEIIASVSKKDIEAVDSKKIFRTHCAICHGFKGNMKINGAKDLTKSKISLTESVAQVYHGKGLMTPYNGIISDAEIVAVSKWIEGFRK